MYLEVKFNFWNISLNNIFDPRPFLAENTKDFLAKLGLMDVIAEVQTAV
jgi:hypothetical protein